MNDPNSPNAPDHHPGSVATPTMVPSCPICGQALKGKQTVCSGKCRIAKWRQGEEAKRQERHAKVRLLLMEALGLLDKQGDDR